MKRWMALLIVFALMGGWITLSGCTWEEVDTFLGSTYGCGCFWDCTKSCLSTADGFDWRTPGEGDPKDPITFLIANGCQFCVDCMCDCDNRLDEE